MSVTRTIMLSCQTAEQAAADFVKGSYSVFTPWRWVNKDAGTFTVGNEDKTFLVMEDDVSGHAGPVSGKVWCVFTYHGSGPKPKQEPPTTVYEEFGFDHPWEL